MIMSIVNFFLFMIYAMKMSSYFLFIYDLCSENVSS